MFERYTEIARRAMFFARYEASQFGASAIEPEHLLLGLSREDKPLFGRFLGDSKQSIETIRTKVQAGVSMKEKDSTPTRVELPLGPETKRALHYAHDESHRLADRHIGTEHMLLGLLRLEDSVAADPGILCPVARQQSIVRRRERAAVSKAGEGRGIRGADSGRH